jgi:L-rhamnose isomerase
MMNETVFNDAKEQYAELGVDVDAAIAALKTIPLSLHCWQTDDVGGFETPMPNCPEAGFKSPGNFPGKAREHRRNAGRSG